MTMERVMRVWMAVVLVACALFSALAEPDGADSALSADTAMQKEAARVDDSDIVIYS